MAARHDRAHVTFLPMSGAVWKRDAGRCAFVAKDGRRCAERGGLEFHHIAPYVLGGEATVRNITLRCRAHNAHEAVAWFGTGSAARSGTSSAPDRTAEGAGRST